MIIRRPRFSATARWSLLCAAMAWALTIRLVAQAPGGPGIPPLVPDSLIGSVSFDLYCAGCHGRSGKGDGPIAPSLITPPADLTTLTRRHGGTFPREDVLSYIEGSTRLEAVHGTPDMPVWGPTLRALDGFPARVSVRLTNLVAFIESLQTTADAGGHAGVDPNGAMLFRTFCAACHGSLGTGNGVMAGQMRQSPPDLTRLTQHNGGVFPSERVRQVIQGRGPAAHGTREMPIWADLFAYSRGGTPDPVAARINALVEYLEVIQRRPGE